MHPAKAKLRREIGVSRRHETEGMERGNPHVGKVMRG